MICGCEHGEKCTKVSACRMADEVKQARQDMIDEILTWMNQADLTRYQTFAIEDLIEHLEEAA